MVFSRNSIHPIALASLWLSTMQCHQDKGRNETADKDPASVKGASGFVFSVSPDPPQVGPSEVSIRLFDPGGNPVKGADVRIEANMTHPGMVPVFTAGTETAPDRYTAPLRFTMKGDWILSIDASAKGFHRQHEVILRVGH